ncbi:hypothetical protein GC175_05820 [bacterium]|nr:hypothetical protein [bacterium]
MKSLKVFLIASLLLLATMGVAAAQDSPYDTPFVTSVTYQNISGSQANVIFNFYPENTGTPTPITVQLAANAGASLFIGGLQSLPSNFSGSAVVSSNQPIVATLVQIPQSSTVVNRPLSNGFSSASSQVTIATVLKNRFFQTTRFSVQNAHSSAVNLTVTFFNADNPAAAPIELTHNNLPVGAAQSFDAGQLAQLPNPFNGSAIITAVQSGTTTPANIVASALELGITTTVPNDVKAFEGVSTGARTVFMPSALCNAFGGQETFYAITNTSASTGTDVTVTYSNGNSEVKTVGGGRKASFRGCDANNPANYNGSATITSSATDIVVIGKVAGTGISSAFLGEPTGAARLALPYVRWTADANYGAGANRQRAFIAIQNVGSAAVSNVTVSYLNKNGETVGTQTIASIAPGAKANSNAAGATLATGASANALIEFGYPEGNPGGGFGGSVIVEGPAGSQLVAVVRVASRLPDASLVAEDYNGMSTQ